jgi:hypothetical protein
MDSERSLVLVTKQFKLTANIETLSFSNKQQAFRNWEAVAVIGADTRQTNFIFHRIPINCKGKSAEGHKDSSCRLEVAVEISSMMIMSAAGI